MGAGAFPRAVFAFTVFALTACSGGGGQEAPEGPGEPVEVSMRLEWFPQTQFAGFLVAHAKGWYEEAKVDMTINPGGPNIKAARQVATGADDFGVTQPDRVISAISQGAPLVQVLQYHQEGMSVYVAMKDSGIESIEDVRGKRVGLWFGGDEFEFKAMLKAAGIDESEVELISQGFTVIPFLKGRYDVSQVTTFNELQLILKQGVAIDDLTILRAGDLGVALIGDGLSTTEEMINEQPEVVQAVVDQSIRGWKYAIENPEEAAQIAVDYNPDLDLEDQIVQMRENAKLVCSGPTLQAGQGLGFIEQQDFEVAHETLLESQQIPGPIEVSEAFTLQFIENVPEEYKTVDCSAYQE